MVITSELALSDTTTTLQRFLYAVDVTDPDGSSVMVFDVTAGATDRTPLVRPGTARLNEPPDRIRFASEAIASVAFGRRDLPQVDENEISTNPFCNPDPAITEPDPAAKYRPSSGPLEWRRPRESARHLCFRRLEERPGDGGRRRGLRRRVPAPDVANPGATENFQGCKNDPDVGEFVIEGTPTVTDEVSCRIVQPHLARSGSFVLTDENAVRAPSLRTLPRFTAPGEVEPGSHGLSATSGHGPTRPSSAGLRRHRPLHDRPERGEQHARHRSRDGGRAFTDAAVGRAAFVHSGRRADAGVRGDVHVSDLPEHQRQDHR